MDKRYQFFISSTCTHLKEERQAVVKAVLQLNQMPAGMELFPASDDSAWQLICDVIDGSDYYLLIVGGRHPSLDDGGLGYAEKEYDYAVQTKKPVSAFFHESPDTLAREKTETEGAGWQNLQTFRAKVENKHACVYWTSAEDLSAKVIIGVTSAMKRHAAIGWVRADLVPTGSTLADVLALKNRVAELETEVKEASMVPPAGTDELQHGEDVFVLNGLFRAMVSVLDDSEEWKATLPVTWNEIFAGVAPTMINEASQTDLRQAFHNYFERRFRSTFENSNRLKTKHLYSFRFRPDEVDTCIVQFRALGLMRESVKPRSIKDTDTYWRLTPYGDHWMTHLRAIRRKPGTTESEAGAESDISLVLIGRDATLSL